MSSLGEGEARQSRRRNERRPTLKSSIKRENKTGKKKAFICGVLILCRHALKEVLYTHNLIYFILHSANEEMWKLRQKKG